MLTHRNCPHYGARRAHARIELLTRQNGSIDSVQNDRVKPQRSYEPHRETHRRHVERLGPGSVRPYLEVGAGRSRPLCGPRLQDKLRATSRIDLRIGALRVGLRASQLARFL